MNKEYKCEYSVLSAGKPRPLSMPVDTCVGIVDPYAKPWARKGQELIFFFLNDRLEFRKKGREAG